MKDFIVDSKGRCFLCVNQTYSNPTSSSSSSAKSIHFLSRYLKMDMGLVFLENEPAPPELLDKVKKSELKVELCENCATLNKTFSRLYRQLERIEIEMNSCLNSFHLKLLTAPDKDLTGSSSIEDDSSGLTGKLKIAKVLRREAMKKCSVKLNTTGPRIKLQNLSSNEILKLKETKKRKQSFHRHVFKTEPGSSLEPTLMKHHHDMADGDLKLEQGPSHGEMPDREDWNMDHSLEDQEGELDNSDIFIPPPAGSNNPNRNLTLTKDSSIKTKAGKHRCNLCGKEFATVWYLRNHYKQQHLKLGYQCSTCDKIFSFPNDLQRHQQSVHMRLRHGCNKCTKTFSDLRSLRRHDNTAHLGPRPRCQFCSSMFPTVGARNRHMRMNCGWGQQKSEGGGAAATPPN